MGLKQSVLGAIIFVSIMPLMSASVCSRVTLLGFAFVYNTSFVYGFIANVLALPLFLWSLGLLKRYLDRPTLRSRLREVVTRGAPVDPAIEQALFGEGPSA